MVNIISNENCKICSKKGELLHSKNYSDEEFINFFNNFYGSLNLKLLMEYIKNEKYVILKCKECSFIWQKFAPDGEFAFKLYEKIIDKEDSLKKSLETERLNKEKFQSKFDTIYNYFNKKKINILDFGAGWGSWINCIDKSKVNLFVFEISSSRKNYLIKNGIKVLDETDIDNYENFFHYIRLEQVLEHLSDLNNNLKLIRKISKNDTIIDVGVPNGIKQIKNNTIDISKGPIQPLEHINCFSNKSLKKLFHNYGYKPLKLYEIFYMGLKNFSLNLRNLKNILKDIFDNFFSTSIRFKSK